MMSSVTSSNRASLLWLLLLACSFCLHLCSDEYLYFASIGGFNADKKKSGLWGGVIDPAANGTAGNLSSTGVYCANLKSAGFYAGLDIKSMAYDPVTDQAVVQMEVLSYTRTSAFTTKICTNAEPKCKTAQTQVIMAQADTQDKNKGNMGPFAMWNGSVYFLADRYERGPSGTRTIRHKIELRKLDGCEDRYPFTISHGVDLEACSSLLSNFLVEIGQDLGFEMEDTLLVARSLYIVGKGGHLTFLTQIQNQTFNDVYDVENFSMLLLAVSDSMPAMVLHEEHLPYDFAEHEIAHLGGISYRDGTLCWSMLDRILCSEWDLEGPLKNVHTVLPPGGASKACSVKNNEIYDNVTTGVAIVSAKDDITLYFGCYAGDPLEGGAGVLKVSRDGKRRHVFPLRDGNGKVYAGSMFLACGPKSSYNISSSERTVPYVGLFFLLLCLFSANPGTGGSS